MGPGLLDLSDNNLRLWHGETLVQSPGYALLDGGSYQFGRAARAAARLRPRDTNTRYWWQLGTEPLQPALGPARHAADLAHAHLEALFREAGEPAELILAVPGSLQREQLSLLLGIVQQCPFSAVGLLHRSVALGSLFNAPQIIHLEIQLHQAMLNELAGNGETLSLTRSAVLPGCGVLQLQERVVELVASAFVRQTRFDPRRKAATEQQLYNALPGALQALALATETVFDIGGYRARVTQQDLLGAGERLFDAMQPTLARGGANCMLLADPIAALLPGLGDRLPALQILDEDAMRRALLAHGERLIERSAALSFVTSLPFLAAPCAGQAPETAAPASAAQPAPVARAAGNSHASAAPTHWLSGARAQPLLEAGCAVHPLWEIHRKDHAWQLRPAANAQPPHSPADSAESSATATPLLNGRDYARGQPLHSGDEIRIGTDIIRLIEVAD
ncbi:MAG: hypothetical protein KDI09_01220 [Halioglobus sp.]|nr:hypothetical protein [Halioglobus sp.]